MNPATVSSLLALNRRFYQDFGASFAATRRRLQPGVRRILQHIPGAGCWFDLGCGGGRLACQWIGEGRQGLYLGLDFSPVLLAEAQAAVSALPPTPGLEVRFELADLSQPGWATALEGHLPAGARWDGALAFAVLHHLPGWELRQRVMQQVHDLLPVGGRFIHSEWQFQHSPRLLGRRLPWSRLGLEETDLEEGDTLLDWRHALPGQPQKVGLRYVHLFSREELARLANESGFTILEEFESDGKEGRLALYQVWLRQGPEERNHRFAQINTESTLK